MEGARPATPDDIPRIAELRRTALAELGGQARGGALFVLREAGPDSGEEGLRDAIGDGDTAVIAGTLDNVIVGYAIGRLDRLRSGGCLGVIDDLFVEEGARGVGVGERMMDDLVTFFSGRGCVGIDALALPGARATKNFFEASRFSARLLVMHRPLAPDAELEGQPSHET